MRLLQRRIFLALVVTTAATLWCASSAGALDVYLTPAEREQIVALVRGDERIVAALGGAKVRVEDVAPWSHDGTRATLIGGGLTLEFGRPQTVEADWPLLEWLRPNGEYSVTTVHYRVESADAIMAWVDLRNQSVVSFDVRDGEVDQSSVRYVDAVKTSAESPASQGSNGLGNGAVVAFGGAILVAGLVAGRVAVRRRAVRLG